MVFTPNGFEPPTMPRALAIEEIPALVDQFANAAEGGGWQKRPVSMAWKCTAPTGI